VSSEPQVKDPDHLLLVVPAISVELFDTVARPEFSRRRNKRESAEIAADFMTTFYHVQVGALETQEFRAQPVPFWLVSFSDTIKGPLRQMFFVVLLPDGTVVVPIVEKSL
jgi:hypothetical protein